MLLFGINGSGKSTLLRTIGCALWLAQCGLYVPCSSYFCFYPFESIYSKINIQDNIYIGHSTFIAEMYELKHILERVHHKSLVLCDELTSGTESQSATALVVSTLIEFIQKNTKFVLTTHLHDVMTNEKIQPYRNRIDILHFEMEMENNDLYIPSIQKRYNRKLLQGTGKSLYGIEIAKQIGLPETFLRRAFEIREQCHISKYNSRLVKTECFLCQSKHDLHTHHITPQVSFQKDSIYKSHKKNGLYNLLVLCRYCHNQLHDQHSTSPPTSK
jgi:DNA mismatch repair protein MutS